MTALVSAPSATQRLNAQVRVAGPPWDGGSFAPAASAVNARSGRTGALVDTHRGAAR